MWFLFSNISASDGYRVEVTTVVEYVPTLTFDSWSPSMASKISTAQTTPIFKELGQNIFNVVTGHIGRQLGGNTITGQLMSQVVPYVGSLLF